MIRLRSHLACIGRLALGLLLSLALMPSLSRAMADADATGPWAELCSSLGSGTRMLLAGEASGGSAPAMAMQQGEHCPLCSHAPPALPAPAAAGLPLLAFGSTSHPLLFAQAPRPLFAWLAAAPRGPPARA